MYSVIDRSTYNADEGILILWIQHIQQNSQIWNWWAAIGVKRFDIQLSQDRGGHRIILCGQKDHVSTIEISEILFLRINFCQKIFLIQKYLIFFQLFGFKKIILRNWNLPELKIFWNNQKSEKLKFMNVF